MLRYGWLCKTRWSGNSTTVWFFMFFLMNYLLVFLFFFVKCTIFIIQFLDKFHHFGWIEFHCANCWANVLSFEWIFEIWQQNWRKHWILGRGYGLHWVQLRAYFIFILKHTHLYSTEISKPATFFWTLNLLLKWLILGSHDLHLSWMTKVLCLIMYPLL